jgi:hypothetical protein
VTSTDIRGVVRVWTVAHGAGVSVAGTSIITSAAAITVSPVAAISIPVVCSHWFPDAVRSVPGIRGIRFNVRVDRSRVHVRRVRVGGRDRDAQTQQNQRGKLQKRHVFSCSFGKEATTEVRSNESSIGDVCAVFFTTTTKRL